MFVSRALEFIWNKHALDSHAKMTGKKIFMAALTVVLSKLLD